jgi:hypothetical protein
MLNKVETTLFLVVNNALGLLEKRRKRIVSIDILLKRFWVCWNNVENMSGLLKNNWNSFRSVEKAVEKTSGLLW